MRAAWRKDTLVLGNCGAYPLSLGRGHGVWAHIPFTIACLLIIILTILNMGGPK